MSIPVSSLPGEHEPARECQGGLPLETKAVLQDDGRKAMILRGLQGLEEVAGRFKVSDRFRDPPSRPDIEPIAARRIEMVLRDLEAHMGSFKTGPVASPPTDEDNSAC